MAEISQTKDYSRLLQKIAPDTQLIRSWMLAGGISAEMTALELTGQSGENRTIVVRQPGPAALATNPRAAEHEYQLLQIASQMGLAVPKPIFLDSSGETLPAPGLVIEYIPGDAVYTPADPQEYARQFATTLARIHKARFDGVDLSFLPQSCTLEDWIGKSPVRINISPGEERARHLLQLTWPIRQTNPSVLLHGDYWPGNVLWRDNQLAAIIDWEDARLGDPLSDFAISRLGILWIFGFDVFEAFNRHYLLQMSLDTSSLPFWDLCAALRLSRLVGNDLAGWAAFFHPFNRTDITEQSIRAYFEMFIQQAFQRLEQT